MTRSEPVSLLASLADVPDPRDRAGRRHPLAAMLAHACCAILCGCRGYAAIAQWEQWWEKNKGTMMTQK